MDLVKTDLSKVFRKYLISSMGSAVITSIYLFVDAVIVGQAAGPAGAATMAVMNPAYGALIFLALVGGIGGSVLMSASWGEGDREEGNRFFTCGVILMAIISVVMWLVLILFHKPLFYLFGADDEIFATTMTYARWIIGFTPLIMLSVFLGCYVRNDGNPGLAMMAVLIGGSFNMVADWAFVFPMGMGISGAGLATVIANAIQIVILSTHFFSGKNHMRLVKDCGFFRRAPKLISVGFGAGMLDLANVILFTLMNQQVMKLGGATYLALFSAVSTLSTFFQSMFAGVGQALQPIVSVNYGAKEFLRVRGIRNRSVLVAGTMGLVCSLFGILCPETVVKVTMDATPEIVALAHEAVRPYSVIFLFMALNVVSTYYLQSTLQDRASTVISLLRGLIISGVMIFLLPAVFGGSSIWLAIPVAEIIVCIVAMAVLYRKNSAE